MPIVIMHQLKDRHCQGNSKNKTELHVTYIKLTLNIKKHRLKVNGKKNISC